MIIFNTLRLLRLGSDRQENATVSVSLDQTTRLIVGFRNKCEVREISATTQTEKSPQMRASGVQRSFPINGY